MRTKPYSLNKNRFRDAKIVAVIAVIIAIFSRSAIPEESIFHEIADFVGTLLIAICALGRVFCSIFIGGIKNQQLVKHGPFSTCRNPLYFFSFIGVVGIGLFSNQLTVFGLLVGSFLTIYHFLIKREEAFLLEVFGKDYEEYCRQVPRFIPNWHLYNIPEKLEVRIKPIQSAMCDAIGWFGAIAVFESIEYLHIHHLIASIGTVY